MTNDGDYGKYIKSLCINKEGYVFAGSDGAGVFRSMDVVSDIHAPIANPYEFKLAQNYPNPFNPLTAINFQLASSSNVRLVVYNLLGQEVKTLLSGKLSAGSHQVVFNASKFSSGVYFYKLMSDAGFVQTRKMVILK